MSSSGRRHQKGDPDYEHLNEVAQNKFGKSYDDLDDHEWHVVIGSLGGEARKKHMKHQDYAAMGQKGGSTGGRARGDKYEKDFVVGTDAPMEKPDTEYVPEKE
jgi:hypothetical protein